MTGSPLGFVREDLPFGCNIQQLRALLSASHTLSDRAALGRVLTISRRFTHHSLNLKGMGAQCNAAPIKANGEYGGPRLQTSNANGL